jgi:hypothetical protein
MLSGRDDEERMMEIEKVSFELDDYFVALANKYELTVSALNGIMMARLLRLNVETQNEENLYKLLRVVLQKDHESWDNRNVH